MSDCNDKTELDSAHAILHLGAALHYKHIWEFMLTLHGSQNGIVHKRLAHEDCILILTLIILQGPMGMLALQHLVSQLVQQLQVQAVSPS